MTDIKCISGDKEVNNCRIAIVASRYNTVIVDRLLAACIGALTDRGIQKDELIQINVPGAFEIPVTVKQLAHQQSADAIIALGAVIRGETPHFDYICNECSRGLSTIALEYRLPVIFGVLTVDTMQQALDRSGDEESNKGAEAANTALEMISIMRKISSCR